MIMEEEVEVPCYFLCPISLQMMRDPVTLPSGITYDRDGIERWLLTAGTCPVTKQPVPADCEPTPNHTLRRLIQSWAKLHGVEQVPTPPTDRARVASLVSRIAERSTPQDELLAALVCALQRAASSRKAHAAALLLKSATAVISQNRLVSLPEQVFVEVVQLIRDKQKAALHVLVGATSWGRNRVKAVDAGAVTVLVDMLLELDDKERRACELALAALDRLCGCAEGRAELVAHAAGVAAVNKMIVMRVSDVATDKAVRLLRSVARHAATPAVLHEMAHTGAVGTLCVVAHSEQHYGQRTRERARETLRRHATAWRTSPCLHRHLQAIYPC